MINQILDTPQLAQKLLNMNNFICKQLYCCITPPFYQLQNGGR